VIDPPSFCLDDYDFDLPEASIAQQPVEPRHAARLLRCDRQSHALSHRAMLDLPDLLPPGTLLVLNDTRVVPARLLGFKATGGRVELMLTRPFSQAGANLVGHEVLFKSGKGLAIGQTLRIAARHGGAGAEARVVALHGGGVAVVDFAGPPHLAALLEACGHVPLPPYIRGGKEDPHIDRGRYQSTYARAPGAVAAPTAGLHLSEHLLAELDKRGIERACVTLHVGPGTFLPVRSSDLHSHRVLPERFEVTTTAALQLEHARRAGRPIVAVGTTTTRTLETLAQRCQGPLHALCGDADLTILPGHTFALTTGMLTNFHLPRSSLLVLVSAFAGRERVLGAYRLAIAHGYRFYSYGDAMLIL